MSFIEDCKVLLKTPSQYDEMDLARTLAVAVEKLESVVEQAEAQFNAGDSHASYNKEFIKALNMTRSKKARVWGGDNIVT